MIYPVNYIAMVRGKSLTHKGVDFGFYSASHHHQPILAVDDGVVIYKKVQTSGGKVIHTKHSNGTVSEYGHMDTWTVDIGDKVKKGQKIGTMGSTGKVTGEHLHYGLCKGSKITYTKKDKWLDPVNYLCMMNNQTCNTKSKKKIKHKYKRATCDLWIHNKKSFDKSSRVKTLYKNEAIEYYGDSGNFAIVEDNINRMYCSRKCLK